MSNKDDFPEISNQRNEWPRQAQKSSFSKKVFLAIFTHVSTQNRLQTDKKWFFWKIRFLGLSRSFIALVGNFGEVAFYVALTVSKLVMTRRAYQKGRFFEK